MANENVVPNLINPPQKPDLSTDPKVIAALRQAWQQSSNGTTPVEAGFKVGQDVKGEPLITPHQIGNQIENSGTESRAGVRWSVDGATRAEFHIHPNAGDPKPSGNDRKIADTHNIPIYTLSQQGLYEYDPVTKQTTQLKKNIDWLTKK